ncbi:MAG: hypothetical protein AB7K24_20095 [Gemmataceae bacterium]
MKKRIQSEFKRIGDLVEASGMTAEEKQRATLCLKKLPPLCLSFCETYESRDLEEIIRLERGILAQLAQPTQSAKARELSKVLGTRLKNLHVRLGLPELTTKS